MDELQRWTDEFLAAITHDLRNPITSIRGFAQVLRPHLHRADGKPDPALDRGLEHIKSATRRLALLVDQLLDAARLQARQALDLERQVSDLVAPAQRLVEEHQSFAPQHALRFESKVATLTGHWDAARLERVMDSLVSNAVKYSPNGGVVTVTVRREACPGGVWAIVSIQDEGLGIPADDLPHIFERFYRGRNVAGRIGGTGLGLAGAREVVEQHGGMVIVETQEGHGTTVTLRVPGDR